MTISILAANSQQNYNCSILLTMDFDACDSMRSTYSSNTVSYVAYA